MNEKFVYVAVLLLCLSPVFAEAYEENFNVYNEFDSSGLQIEALRYEPYPANPGEYFNLWILVSKGGSGSGDVRFELDLQYPFSLDSNEDSVREFRSVLGDSILLEYKIRIDADAVEGDNPLDFRYQLDRGAWISQEFDIYVSDAQTSFDGVIQSIENGAISLALANTGKNVANSVIVKIPEQEGFEAIGTSGQMVGNLDNGDYTIVGFNVKNLGGSHIKFQIDYTDDIDERRTVILELPLDLEARTSVVGAVPGTKGSGIPPSDDSSVMIYVWLVAGLVVLFVLYRKRDWVRGLFSKNGNHKGKPGWMKKTSK